MKNILPINRVLVFIAAILMVSAYFTPLWQISLWAPQYPEGLNMKIWIDKLSGDVDIINGVNHYIGMKHIGAEMFPEFTYLIYVFGLIISIGILAAIIGKKWLAYSFLGLIVLLGIGVIVDMYLWGYDYGHNLDPTAAIKVPGMAYQPPLIGYKELLNFLAYSGPDIGGWILGVSAAIMVVVVVREWRRKEVQSTMNQVPSMGEG
jgi:copper chaperone NosL